MADPHVVCPFDKSHKIMMSRLQGHLLKCMKSHSMTGPTICPFNNQHIIDASQIVEHCIICPNIKDVLIQVNNCGNKGDFSNNDVSSTSTSTYNSADKIENDNTAHSNTEMKTETSHLQFLKRPKNEKSQTSIKVPDAREAEKIEKSKNPSQDVFEKKIIPEEHHTDTSDAGSINLNSHYCDQPKLLSTVVIDYGEIYRKLEALEKKEMAIAEEMQILRHKEKEIGEEKKQLIETLKNIAFYTNTTNEDNKDDTDTENNIDKHNEQHGNTSKYKLQTNSNNFQDIKPSMTSLISSPPTPGSPPNTNKMRSFGRGIMRAYNKKKTSNRTDQS